MADGNEKAFQRQPIKGVERLAKAAANALEFRLHQDIQESVEQKALQRLRQQQEFQQDLANQELEAANFRQQQDLAFRQNLAQQQLQEDQLSRQQRSRFRSEELGLKRDELTVLRERNRQAQLTRRNTERTADLRALQNGINSRVEELRVLTSQPEIAAGSVPRINLLQQEINDLRLKRAAILGVDFNPLPFATPDPQPQQAQNTQPTEQVSTQTQQSGGLLDFTPAGQLFSLLRNFGFEADLKSTAKRLKIKATDDQLQRLADNPQTRQQVTDLAQRKGINFGEALELFLKIRF